MLIYCCYPLQGSYKNMLQMDGYEITPTFPTLITPLKTFSQQTFLENIKLQRHDIQQLLWQSGALLFRGFPICHAVDFSNTIEALGLGKLINYIGGDSPRNKVTQKIYTSTEAPANLHIPLHQELSFMKYHPRYIYFYCEEEPKIGGETIIGNARLIYQQINPEVKQHFLANQLIYTSRYYYSSRIMKLLNQLYRSHKSWVDVFETHHKQVVEQHCIENEFTWRWLKKDWLEIKQVRPAINVHPITKESIWFNQAHLYDFNCRLLGLKNYLGSKLLYLRPETLLHEIHFDDGSPVLKKDLYHIMDVLQSNTVAYPWQKGDVMVLDNMLTMHGRAPFKGPRRVLTAMTN